MEVSVESATATASPLTQSFPGSPNNPRKRTFSKVEDSNTNTAEFRKLQRFDDPDNQENRDPLGPEPMLLDRPSTVDAMPSTTTAPLPSSTIMTADKNTIMPGGQQSELHVVSINPTAHGHALAPTSTPPKDIDATAATAIAIADDKTAKAPPASKEAKRLEKEEKERLKLEEKAKKEEEKRIKEEEKKKKDAEREEEKRKRDAEREEERKKREEKKKIKEEEKQAKDEEKRKREEENEKKERSQMRLNAFFAKPATRTPKSTSAAATTSPRKTPSGDDTAGSATPGPEPEMLQTDYRKDFPDFFIQSHTQLAPQHRFQRDFDAIQHIRQKLDSAMGSQDQAVSPSYRASELFSLIPYRRKRGRNVIPVKTILKKLQDHNNIVDLTGESANSTNAPHPKQLLAKIQMKALKFGEDVRPPYHGTFTRSLSSPTARKLCCAPYSRTLPEVNYDYDSEAEWEEPEEGEDLDSDGEEDQSDDGDDDMDGFLDDEEDNIDGKRRLIVGELDPVSTGIRWEGENGLDSDMQAYRIEVISDTVQYPINPFSTIYWPRPKALEQAASKGSLAPPSIPVKSTLHAYTTNPPHTQSPLVPPSGSAESLLSGKTKKLFPSDQLAEFKEAVEGSDLTKTGLVEVLKKRFPKISKDVLKDTLNLVAVRVGQKEADKKWVCK